MPGAGARPCGLLGRLVALILVSASLVTVGLSDPPAASAGSPFRRVLTVGDRGADVQRLQAWLTNVGIPTAADGIYGLLTSRSVQRFQHAAHLSPATGTVGVRTATTLKTWTATGKTIGPGSARHRRPVSSPFRRVLTVGDRGADVQRLQAWLTNVGIPTAADGIYGLLTSRSVQRFQHAAHLSPATGTVGVRTATTLKTWTATGKTIGPGSARHRRPVSSPFRRVLTVGDRGADVQRLQAWLTNVGIPTAADGIYGLLTSRSVQRFQHAAHLSPATGTVGVRTATTLQTWTATGKTIGPGSARHRRPVSSPFRRVLTVGDRGADVQRLQAWLTNLGIPTAADGIYGLLTSRSVQRFQHAAHLSPATGTVGVRTATTLKAWTATGKTIGPGSARHRRPVSSPFRRVLTVGDRGADVQRLQAWLTNVGIPTAADGIYGLL